MLGDRTVGIDEKPTQDYLDRVRDVFGFEPPRHHGHHTIETVEAMEQGTAKVFIGMGGISCAPFPIPSDPMPRCASSI